MSPTIEIYCDDDSHEGRREHVALLRRAGQMWEDTENRRGAELVVQFVAEDHPLTGRRYPEPPLGRTGPSTVRYRLACDCGRVVVLRGETAVPIFDRLAATDVCSVSLRGLASVT